MSKRRERHDTDPNYDTLPRERSPAAVAADKKPLLPATAKELIAAHAELDDNSFLWALRRLPEHEKDLLVECKVCGAGEGQECRGTNRLDRRKLKAAARAVITGPDAGFLPTKKLVHIGRRIKRLMKGIR